MNKQILPNNMSFSYLSFQVSSSCFLSVARCGLLSPVIQFLCTVTETVKPLPGEYSPRFPRASFYKASKIEKPTLSPHWSTCLSIVLSLSLWSLERQYKITYIANHLGMIIFQPLRDDSICVWEKTGQLLLWVDVTIVVFIYCCKLAGICLKTPIHTNLLSVEDLSTQLIYPTR